MAKKAPQLRKGLTREDLLKNTWLLDRLSPDYKYAKLSEFEKEALQAFMRVLDHLIAYVNAGNTVTRRDIITFLGMVETCSGIRGTINERIGKGELVPTLLDKIAQAADGP